MRYYTGIGSRQTPAHILSLMTQLAAKLEERGWKVRSGGAGGADIAFERGVKNPSNKEIYVPWPKFNEKERLQLLGYHDDGSLIYNLPSSITKRAEEMAAKYHPAWHRCSQGAKKLHSRNCHQVLGQDLATPVEFVSCWTPGGDLKGGTAQALRIAMDYNIPIRNLGIPAVEAAAREFLAA